MKEKHSTIIKAKDISKSYRMGNEMLHVLKGIDFEIHEKDYVLIMGPSGSGKSTLMHIMGGLDNPDSGEVLVEDMNFYSISDRKRSSIRNNKIGFIFQFYHLLPELSALDNVFLPWMISKNKKKISYRDAQNKAMDLLKIVGLEKRVKHRPSELSGGEQQRVAIARALINSPRVVLADEPSGNLDKKTGEKIYDLLKEINESLKTSILVVTHNPDLVGHAKRSFFIEDGKLVN